MLYVGPADLSAAIGYPEIVSVMVGSTNNIVGRPVEIMFLTFAVYRGVAARIWLMAHLSRRHNWPVAAWSTTLARYVVVRVSGSSLHDPAVAALMGARRMVVRNGRRLARTNPARAGRSSKHFGQLMYRAYPAERWRVNLRCRPRAAGAHHDC
jgi:hypothetical protein